MSLAAAFEAVIAARFADPPWPEDLVVRAYNDLIDALAALARKMGADAEQAEALAARGLRIVHHWEMDEELSPEGACAMARGWMEEQLRG